MQRGMVALLVLGWLGAAHARTPQQVCRHACWDAIGECARVDGKFAKCRRLLWGQCRRDGIAACMTRGGATTTTLPWFIDAGVRK